MTDSASMRLPERPSLEQLRKQAKDLLHAWREGDAAAAARVRAHKQQASVPVLADVYFALAREYGFESWPALVQHIENLRDPRKAPHGLSTTPPFYKINWKTRTIEPQQPMSTADWERLFDVVEEVELTGLDAHGQLTDEILARVSRLHRITRLNLGGCKRVSDEGLQHLARMPQLEELDLSDYPGGQITDRGLDMLRHLTELRHFHMCWQGGITDAGVSNLSYCDKLENVNLLGSPTGDGAINALRGKRYLSFLRSGRQVTDTALPWLHDFPVFKSWQGKAARYDLMSFGDAEPNFLMLDGPFTDAGLDALAGLDGLFGVGFFWHVSRMTADGLRGLTALPNLGALGCEGKICDDTAMRHIAAIPRLRMLMAQGTVAGDEGFAALSRSQTIEYIWGRECPNLRGRGFSALANMKALKGLAVSCKLVDDDSLASLPTFPALRWLLPMDVRDEGFRHVGRCDRLEKLTCMYCRDTGDRATEHLAGLTKLKHYYAGQTLITDRSLEVLGGIESLEEVQLSACKGITNAGLVHLAKLPRLRQVSVDATATVTRAGISVFSPGVHVDFWT